MRPDATYRTSIRLTRHARERMKHRGVGEEAIDLVVDHGREVFTRGAVIYAIGRKEVERAREHGLDLEGLEGLQVVCAEGAVLTVYRNRDFRGLTRRQRRVRRRGW
jgi:hypothetical protein